MRDEAKIYLKKKRNVVLQNYVSIGNSIISSAITDKQARVSF